MAFDALGWVIGEFFLEDIAAGFAGDILFGGELASIGAGAFAGSELVSGFKTAATILSPISSIAQLASGERIQPMVNGPGVKPAVTMPTFGSADTLNAMRADIQEQVVRRGRAATILTSPTGEGTKLGA